MGNWRTVNITGTMTGAHAAKLRSLLDYGTPSGPNWEMWKQPWACLLYDSIHPGLCGLGAWPAVRVSRCGNLAERGYSVQDVAEALRALLPHAGSMLLKVHCGGEYEDTHCVATISVGEGLVVTGKPEVADVEQPSDDQVLANLARNLTR